MAPCVGVRMPPSCICCREHGWRTRWSKSHVALMSTGPVPTSSWDGPRNGSRSTARRHTYVAWLLIVRTADHLDAEAA